MPELPTIESYLGVEGQRVVLEDVGPDSPSPLSVHLARAARWLDLRAHPSPSPRVLSLHGSASHGAIRFIGDLENRMVEPLVLTLRALATGHVDLDTPATVAFLHELERDIHLHLVVGVTCPFCPAATAVVLRLACVSDHIHVDVVRADLPDAPRVGAVPTLLAGRHRIASGTLQEMDLVETLLSLRPG